MQTDGNWIKMYDTSCCFLEYDIIIIIYINNSFGARFPSELSMMISYEKIIECKLISHCIELTHQRQTKKKTGNDSAY